jgi:hypothetical protein
MAKTKALTTRRRKVNLNPNGTSLGTYLITIDNGYTEWTYKVTPRCKEAKGGNMSTHIANGLICKALQSEVDDKPFMRRSFGETVLQFPQHSPKEEVAYYKRRKERGRP